MDKIKALIIAYSEKNFDSCTYYIVEIKKSDLKNLWTNEEKFVEGLLLKIKNKNPIAETSSYTDYLKKTIQLSKNQKTELEIEIDLGRKKVL
ncbi:hypothetical protein [Persephonella sp. KM09-Lau-8]|uniref:hypothetical protein n=1 Tax=Persephonella sp. KM09-Lau-8 TaxID=1158345 RepID=UPI0004981DA1|nr:hypothetical protein [Persephonella sp. KM09-Lau-8]